MTPPKGSAAKADAPDGAAEVQEQPKSQVPATATPSSVPAHLAERMAADAGKGTSKDQADNLVPLIYVLQKGSPQVDKRSPEYLNGAEEGMFWLRNAPIPLVNGEKDGMEFQPCYFYKDFVEWIPRDDGGGFVARHDTIPAEAVKEEDEKNPNKVRYTMPNGNEIVETRYHVGFVHLGGGVKIPYILPLTSTGHSVSRAWMFQMNSKAIGGGKIAPSWACLYKLKTRQRSNSMGTWWTIEVADAGENGTTKWVSAEDYEAGLALHSAFATGAKQAEAPVTKEAVAGAEAGEGGGEQKDGIPF